MATVLFEPGDRVPPLELVRAARVMPFDTVWGIQAQDNLRKGFLLETEGFETEWGAIPVGKGKVRIGQWAEIDDTAMVLVQVRP